MGLNIRLPENLSCHLFLESLLVYKGKIPDYRPYKHNGLMKLFELSQFHLKFYNKGAKHNLQQDLLRIELVSVKKQFLQQMNIYFVQDLFQPITWHKLNNMLLRITDHLVFYDSRITSKLSEKDTSYFIRFNTAQDWASLMKNHPFNYRKQKVIFRKRINYVSGFDWNTTLSNLLKEWSDELIRIGNN